eukprot:CCRYP_016415-RA/>CCRYP_016415-RA protein AED:0.24 eAED:0.24 QI:29/1/1/1/0/0.33/3/150/45
MLPTTIGSGGYILGARHGTAKLSPQTEFGISPCTAVLPTTVCRGM